MRQEDGDTSSSFCGIEGVISRRAVVCSSGVAILGLLGGSAFGQEQIDEKTLEEARQRRRQEAQEAGRRAEEAAFQRALERSPNLRVLHEEMERGGGAQDLAKAMEDWQRKQSLENLKQQLGASEEEWKIIQPRLEKVYLLRHPPVHIAAEDTSASAMVTRLINELWELLNNKETKPEEIKTKLTALRNAKEKVHQELAKARQELRKLMTIRQEAVLVLSELLD